MDRRFAFWMLGLALLGCGSDEGSGPETEEPVPVVDAGTTLERDAAASTATDAGASTPDARSPGIGDGERGAKDAGKKPSGGATPTSAASSVAPTSDGADEASDSDPSGKGDVASGSISVPSQSTVRPGTLTAGSWDDNLNFEHFQQYRSELTAQLTGRRLPLSDDEVASAQAEFALPRTPHVRLDIALAIDTTGSMGDEIRYLQTEFDAISRAIEAAYPSSQQRWSLVVYRDEGDEYVTRYFDFRGDPAEFRTHLAAQKADGGGDFPEAPQAAFEVLNQFSWRTEPDVARLAFWVADAPHHDQQAEALAKGIRGARAHGIHVYPIASSGVDELTELTMRSAAQLTGGRYLFLTDDSGVGGVHKEPTIPCYFVTKLDEALLRVVEAEMSGVVRTPSAASIVRTVGSPAEGKCQLGTGKLVTAF